LQNHKIASKLAKKRDINLFLPEINRTKYILSDELTFKTIYLKKKIRSYSDYIMLFSVYITIFLIFSYKMYIIQKKIKSFIKFIKDKNENFGFIAFYAKISILWHKISICEPQKLSKITIWKIGMAH
jgi:hypothetical protein